MPEPYKQVDLPTLDRFALVCADLAFIETPGPAFQGTQAAVRAYLWAMEFWKLNGVGPSLLEWREAVERDAR